MSGDWGGWGPGTVRGRGGGGGTVTLWEGGDNCRAEERTLPLALALPLALPLA